MRNEEDNPDISTKASEKVPAENVNKPALSHDQKYREALRQFSGSIPSPDTKKKPPQNSDLAYRQALRSMHKGSDKK